MISYERELHQTVSESSVKIVGLGGAGSNMLGRAKLDGLSGAEMVCINTDVRTLTSTDAKEKIQIGRNLTKGLGAGGDPAVGLKAAHEAELEIRESFRGRKMVFLCVGLGGGTGSGAAPLICRLAREEGAFVVVFATMPFTFEGERRRNQAETALNELAVLANALVTFDNNRMGELVVANQGIHEAFAAADRMIAESVKAVTRLVIYPGLINVGLDDLMSALNTTRSRCLFGTGMAKGENRTQKALENTLSSPLLDEGKLLSDATTVLVHICGGKSLTLHEVESLMNELSKHIPETAHLLFGAAVDSDMGDQLSVTLVSALPENKLVKMDDGKTEDEEVPESILHEEGESQVESEITEAEEGEPMDLDDVTHEGAEGLFADETLETLADEDALEDDGEQETFTEDFEEDDDQGEVDEDVDEASVEDDEAEALDEEEGEASELPLEEDLSKGASLQQHEHRPKFNEGLAELARKERRDAQAELELDGAPKGKFEGETPNVVDGEDLDIPPYLRKNRR